MSEAREWSSRFRQSLEVNSVSKNTNDIKKNGVAHYELRHFLRNPSHFLLECLCTKAFPEISGEMRDF